MNSMTAYALGFELNRTLPGSMVAGLRRYTGGATLSLEGSPIPYLHVLFHGREAELLPSSEMIASGGNSIEAARDINGSRVLDVRPLGLDRIILVRLGSSGDWGERCEFILRIALTPVSRPLALFRGAQERLTDTFGPPRSKRPSSPGETPAEKPYSLLDLSESPPGEIMGEPGKVTELEHAPGHTIRWDRINRTSNLLVTLVGGVDPGLAQALSRKHGGSIENIWPDLVRLGRRLAEGSYSWNTYDLTGMGEAGRCVVYPLRLPVDERPAGMQDFVEALARRGSEVIVPAYVNFLRKTALLALRRGLKKAERLKRHLSEDLVEAGRSKEYRHYGNLLVTHRHLMKAGMGEISVRDFSGDRSITIPLAPVRSPDENIRLYFVKAKKGEKGILIIRNRRRSVEREIDERRDFIRKIEQLSEPDELLGLIPEGRRPSRPGRDTETPARFRRFALDERHTVLVGRSDRENDLLTHRHSAPGDVWFHAQGISGSHVILKGATPSTPKRILGIAASIAAYFSKARHSDTVPVIYTEKRYVRKPRKSRPGTAVCLRGKTLFVKPSLPEDTNG